MPAENTDRPQTMAAVVTRRGGSVDAPGSLVDAQVPAPAAPVGHDLLVEVRAVSVNPVDVKVRAAGGRERILGWDAAGIVRRVGEEVSLFRPGDEVFYAGSLDRPGSNARLQLVDERIVARKPAALGFAEAAALPLTAITAWEALFDKLGLGADTTGTLLVLGAPGGVGSILIQLAKTLTSLQVIATASRAESREWVEQMGADVVLDHRDPDLADRILEAAPGGADYAFSAHSAGRVPLFTRVMRPFGQIVAIDDEHDLPLFDLKDKAISWHWEFMFARPRHGWDLIAQHDLLERVAELADSGRIRSTRNRTLSPLEAATLREAHRLVESGRTVGKIVVEGWALPE